MNTNMVHTEEFLHLVHVTDTTALLSWGRYYFNDKKDELLTKKERARLGLPTELFGRNASRSYGPVSVTWWPRKVGRSQALTLHVMHNYIVLRNLQPDTFYEYEIVDLVSKQVYGSNPHSWNASKKRLEQSNRTYVNVFHTFPSPRTLVKSNVNFAAIGDYGRGVDKKNSNQAAIAESMIRVAEQTDLRFVLTTGDNVYSGGAVDDDWYFKFYEPYRFVINRVAFFPAMGNHDGPSDSSDADSGDDRAQLYDNFFFLQTFPTIRNDEALHYKFKFGLQLEFVALDSTETDDASSSDDTHVLSGKGKKFLKETFSKDSAAGLTFKIPFFHHPPLCAGPKYGNNKDLKKMVDKYIGIDPSVALILNGHEHNFQQSYRQGINYVVTGGGGEIRKGEFKKSAMKKAKTLSYSANAHFCMLSYKYREHVIHVQPIGKGSEPLTLTRVDGRGNELETSRTGVIVTSKKTFSQK